MNRKYLQKLFAGTARSSKRLRRPRFESLESRYVMTVATAVSINDMPDATDLPIGCLWPISLAGQNNQAAMAAASLAPASSLSNLPSLHSDPGATAKLFLDFDGHFEATWGGYSNVTTPAFDQDGNPSTTFSSGELAAINEIWSRVTEDYAPFNVDVTTADPGTEANGVAAIVAIGGSYSDWYGAAAGGVSFVGGFSNSASNVGYVFSTSLGGNAKYIAEAAAHEAGHLFGLQHQAQWNGNTLVTEYNPGSGDWAPIMGVGYYMPRTTWYNGPTPSGPTVLQDDMAIISNSTNGFGYKTDDYGNTIATASPLPHSGTSVTFPGLIGRNGDTDMWSFTTASGAVSFQLTGAPYGTDLDSVLELDNSAGQVVTSNAPTDSYGASISTTVSAGTYYLVAHSNGDYGDVGQYTITGTLPSATGPQIVVDLGAMALTNGQTVNFGTTTQGTPITQTFTVVNNGAATLSLTPLNAASMPAGFTLVSNLGATSLAPGQSTTFAIQLNASAAGTFSGAIALANSDSTQNPFNLTLTGTVTAPKIVVDLGTTALTNGQTVNFGTTTQGTPITQTFTVIDNGTATLSLTPLNAASMPAGFTLVSNLGSTTLGPGQSTTFTIRLDATAPGTFSGAIALANSDSTQNPFNLTLTGTVTAPKIVVDRGTTALTNGQTVNFGTSTQGTTITQTFTVVDNGTAALSLTPLNAASMPAGFTLVSNLGATSLAPGQSTTFAIQLNAAAPGTFSGAIALANGDSTQNPFNLMLAGTVMAPPLNAGGVASGSYQADQDYSGGSGWSTTAAIDTSGVSNPAPQAVYQSVRYGNFSYVLPGLAPGASYTVRLHFAEVFYTAAGQRIFNVQINGSQVLTNFDIVAAAGAANKAVVKPFTVTADSAGKITINFVSVQGDAIVNGIEVLAASSNSPPTVATPASASSTPVTGTTTNLSVLGNDADTGESSLIYSWSVVNAPSGASTPNISINGTNAAKNTTATFFQAGNYTFRATLTDASGASVISDVSVTVNQTPTIVAVTPATANVTNGSTQSFSASALDQFGAALMSQPSFIWSIDSGGIGSVDNTGLYTAPTSGTGSTTVRATGGGMSGTTTVTVLVQSGPILALDAGGVASGSYQADQDYSGGSGWSTTAAIDTSGVSNPAPQAVYQSVRYGNFSYVLPGLTPGASYTVRLHFAEVYYTASGQRTFNVQINGNQVLTNFDIVAAAGAADKAVVTPITVTADSAGKITINFVSVQGDAMVNGIEVVNVR
jgi:hypothetical protein